MLFILNLQAFGLPTTYAPFPLNQQTIDGINALGNLGVSVRRTADQNADILSRVQYTINASVRNMFDAFPMRFMTDRTLDQVRQMIVPAMMPHAATLHGQTIAMLTKAADLQKAQENMDIPLGRILNSALNDGTSCLQTFSTVVSNTLMMRTASVPAAINNVCVTSVISLSPLCD